VGKYFLNLYYNFFSFLSRRKICCWCVWDGSTGERGMYGL